MQTKTTVFPGAFVSLGGVFAGSVGSVLPGVEDSVGCVGFVGGSVGGSVEGSVGSVVGSVAGSVEGSVLGSVGSIGADGSVGSVALGSSILQIT